MLPILNAIFLELKKAAMFVTVGKTWLLALPLTSIYLSNNKHIQKLHGSQDDVNKVLAASNNYCGWYCKFTGLK